MNNQNQQQIGEEQITPQVQQQVTPDLVSPQGKQALQGTLAQTIIKKKFLDFLMKGIADKVGADFNSRVKDPETVIQKVATKRASGRDYDLNDVNDNYGGRFVIKNPDDKDQIEGMLKKAEDLGVFKIGKQQEVKQATYHAFHTDITTPDGVKGEIQIMTPQEELEAVSNHGLRSVFGEKPPPQVAKLRDMQAQLASKISNNDAQTKSDQITQIAKQGGNQPLDPRIIAGILQQPQGGQNG